MTKPTANVSPEKAHCFDYLDRNAKAIATLNDSIFYFGELGMQEFETAELMCDLLENGGFQVERGIAGFPTGFCATYGSGAPVIAIHTEYDSNPDNSQASGVAEQTSIVEGAPGHCEGHNVNGAVLVACALAAKAAMEKFGLKGTLKVFGAPAEEQLVSRPYFVRDGWFDDVDVAIADHIGAGYSVGYGLIQSALISATFTFHGETAHAGVAPRQGPRCARRRRADGHGARAIPRAHDAQHARTPRHHQRRQPAERHPAHRRGLVDVPRLDRRRRAANCSSRPRRSREGAALMTNTSVEIDVISAVWPVRGNRTLAELFQREIESGRPAGLDQGGGRPRPRRAGEGQGAGRGPQAHASIRSRARRCRRPPPMTPATSPGRCRW